MCVASGLHRHGAPNQGRATTWCITNGLPRGAAREDQVKVGLGRSAGERDRRRWSRVVTVVVRGCASACGGVANGRTGAHVIHPDPVARSVQRRNIGKNCPPGIGQIVTSFVIADLRCARLVIPAGFRLPSAVFPVRSFRGTLSCRPSVDGSVSTSRPDTNRTNAHAQTAKHLPPGLRLALSLLWPSRPQAESAGGAPGT